MLNRVGGGFVFFILFSFCFAESNSKIDKAGIKEKSEAALSPQRNLKTLYTQKKGSVPFKVEILVEGLEIPWGMVFLNKDELLWTEREGFIKKIHIPTGEITEITGGPKVHARYQGGLLDVALHPEFKKNKWIYFSYSIRKKDRQTTALARGKLAGDKIKGLKLLFTAKPFLFSVKHYGSRLAFDNKGFLFMTIGDRGQRKSSQDLNSHFGAVLRLNDKGRAVSDNPFVKTRGAKPEIWSFGHRNPQGLFIHPETKQIWVNEHGPKGGDEINLIKKGANYGWPVITYGRSYAGFKVGEGTHKKGMEQPITHWTPSIAPSGLLIYSGRKFPQWKGDFFSGALALTHLNKLKFKDNKFFNEQRLLSSLRLRFRNVIEGPEGFIYAGVDRGMILKISPHPEK